MTFDRPNKPWALVALLAIALAIRLAWAMTRPADPVALAALPDQVEYLQTAQNLLAGDGLCFTDPRLNDRVCAYRTPGYPLMLIAVGANVRAARVLQCLLDTSAVLAAYFLAQKWLDRKSAFYAAAIVALNPFLVYFCGSILTETLFTAMLAWGMVLLASRRTLLWIAGGAVLALSCLVGSGYQ